MCESCDWGSLQNQIEAMLDSGEFEWASDTLEGILSTIESKEHSTDAQQTAVDNIAAARPNWNE